MMARCSVHHWVDQKAHRLAAQTAGLKVRWTVHQKVVRSAPHLVGLWVRQMVVPKARQMAVLKDGMSVAQRAGQTVVRRARHLVQRSAALRVHWRADHWDPP